MGSGGCKSASRVQGWSPGRGSGGRSPPEAEALLLNKHAIFNTPLMKIVINGYIIKILLHSCHFSKIHNAHLKFLHILCSRTHYFKPWFIHNGVANHSSRLPLHKHSRVCRGGCYATDQSDILTLCGLTNQKTHQGGLGLSRSVHEVSLIVLKLLNTPWTHWCWKH